MNADPGAAGGAAPAQPATPAVPATPEANTQQTPATPPAASDIAQREAAREQTWESLKAEILDGQAPASADANTQQTQTPADPWEAHKPKGPPIQSLRDRLLAKEGRQLEQTKAQQLEAQLQQHQQALQQNQWQQQQAERAYQEAMQRGDVDAALKARGIQQGFEEIQRQKLIQMGALQGQAQDPRVDQLLAHVQQQEQLRQQQHQAWQRQQEQQRQQQEYQEHLAVAKTELLSLGLPDIAEFVELPGAVQSVFQTMVNNPNLTTAQAAALVRDDYLNQLGSPVSKWLAKVNGAQPQPQQVQSSGLPAAAPLGQRPANLSREEAWEWDKRELGWA